MESAARTAAPTIDVGHVLHLGERNFFLDLQEELRLTEQQQQTLVDYQRQWLSIRDSQETAIDEVENRLWELTQKLPPNQDELSNTIGNITQLYAAQRQAFIEAVSKAAQELTPEQIAIARSLPLEGDS